MEDKKTDIADLVLDLSNNTVSWEVSYDSDILGTVKGMFIFKAYLNPLDTLAAGRLYRELLGPNAALVTEFESSMAFAISQLSKRVIKSPPFWQMGDGILPGNIPDPSLLLQVLDAAMSAQGLYKQTLKERKEKALERSKKAVEEIEKKVADDKNPEPEKEF